VRLDPDRLKSEDLTSGFALCKMFFWILMDWVVYKIILCLNGIYSHSFNGPYRVVYALNPLVLELKAQSDDVLSFSHYLD
jgi:hypothetical protein